MKTLDLEGVVIAYDPELVNEEKVKKEERASTAACCVAALVLIGIIFGVAVALDKSQMGMTTLGMFVVMMVLCLVMLVLLILACGFCMAFGAHVAYGKQIPECADTISGFFKDKTVKINKVGDGYLMVHFGTNGSARTESLDYFLRKSPAAEEEKKQIREAFENSPELVPILQIIHDKAGGLHMKAVPAKTILQRECVEEEMPKMTYPDMTTSPLPEIAFKRFLADRREQNKIKAILQKEKEKQEEAEKNKTLIEAKDD